MAGPAVRETVTLAAHHEAGHVCDRHAAPGGHGQGELGDRAWLVDHRPRAAMLRSKTRLIPTYPRAASTAA
jgi:hypothetical protein